MRRIIAQDKEVKRSSKEAIWLIGKATELLLQQIASDLAGLVAKQGRSTIRYQDIGKDGWEGGGCATVACGESRLVIFAESRQSQQFEVGTKGAFAQNVAETIADSGQSQHFSLLIEDCRNCRKYCAMQVPAKSA